MTTNLKFQSPVDPESIVLVSKENNWKNIKVYTKGSLQYQSEDGEDLRTGRKMEIEGAGILELHLKDELEVTLGGVTHKALNTDAEDKVANVSTIFWVLTGFTAIGLVFIFLLKDQLDQLDPSIFLISFVLQVFALLVYGITAILLLRKVYWFYFVGTGTFTLFTAMEFLELDLILTSSIVMVRVLIKLVLLALTIRILPIILKYMRTPDPSEMSDIILDQH